MLRRIRDGIRHEAGLKIFAVVVATILWLYVVNTKDPIRQEPYPCAVSVTNVPAGRVVVGIQPKEVTVHLRGRLSELDRRALTSLRAIADLSGAKQAYNVVTLTVEGVPERVTSEQIEPLTVRVQTDRRVQEERPVELTLRGDPAAGHEVNKSGVKIEPASVHISGPAGDMGRMAKLAAAVDVTGWKATRSLSVEVRALDAQGDPVPDLALAPPEVMVDVPVQRVAKVERPVRVEVGKPAAGFELADVRVSPDTVTIEGRPEVLARVKEVATRGVRIRGLQDTKAHSVSVDLVKPPGVRLQVSSVRVQVTVRAKPEPQTLPPSGEGEAAGAGDGESAPATEARPDGGAANTEGPGTPSGVPPAPDTGSSEPPGPETKG